LVNGEVLLDTITDTNPDRLEIVTAAVEFCQRRADGPKAVNPELVQALEERLTELRLEV
jgi:hypothetical protein